MRDADGTFRTVDVLTARTRRTVQVDMQIVGIDIHVHIFGFGQYRHRHRRGMNAPAGFGCRHALYAMGAAFVFELAVSTKARDHKGNFLITAKLCSIRVNDFHFPALLFHIAAIHTKEVTGKERCFFTADTATDFHDDVFIVIGVFGQQQNGQLIIEDFLLRL